MKPAARERNKVDRELKRLGFGGLDDPTLFDQIAYVLSCKGPELGHRKFRSMLLSVEPAQRQIAYQSIAPKLSFKARPLEDYEREGAEVADQLKLPTYDPKTLMIEEWRPQVIETVEYRQKRSALELAAEQAIVRDLRETGAQLQLTLTCEVCTHEGQWRVKRKDKGLKIARNDGWLIKDYSPVEDGLAKQTLCPACKRSRGRS